MPKNTFSEVLAAGGIVKLLDLNNPDRSSEHELLRREVVDSAYNYMAQLALTGAGITYDIAPHTAARGGEGSSLFNLPGNPAATHATPAKAAWSNFSRSLNQYLEATTDIGFGTRRMVVNDIVQHYSEAVGQALEGKKIHESAKHIS